MTVEYCMARDLLSATAHAAALSVCLVSAACGSRESGSSAPAGAVARAAEARLVVPEAATPEADRDPRPRIVALGDSLTAGLGLAPADSYPSLLQRRLAAAGLRYRIVNAGVSGDTSAGGLSRLDWALDGDVRVLIVALGGNDALRALPVDELRRNLAQIIERAEARRISVVLAGMEAPTNFGRDYIVSFRQVYADLVATYHVAFVPFLLQGVAGIESLNQADGIHPTPAGARIVADNVWAVLEPVLDRAGAGRAAR